MKDEDKELDEQNSTSVGDTEQGPSLGDADVNPLAPPPGLLIDRYMVVAHLGQGGMGVVYKAYDPELDRRVAIKLLRFAGGEKGTRYRMRFLREAQAMAQLSHPNVVGIYDVGTFEGQVFIAMEYIEGVTLDSWLSSEERTQKEILDVFQAAGRGLQAAHKKGLVHRDFKPTNVIVDLDGQVRVLDFGLARAVSLGATQPDAEHEADPEADTETGLPSPSTHETPSFMEPSPDSSSQGRLLTTPITLYGSVVGTPRYISPEQLFSLPVDARADQYSFCVALYEALYKALPFRAKSAKELKRCIVDSKLAAVPRDHKVPTWLRNVLLRSLVFDPGQRFPSMEVLLDALADDPAIRRKKRLKVSAIVLAFASAVSIAVVSMLSSRIHCELPADELVGTWDEQVKSSVKKSFLATGQNHASDTFIRVERLLDDYVQRYEDALVQSCEDTHQRDLYTADVLNQRVACLRERRGALLALTQEFMQGVDKTVVDKAVTAAAGLPGLGLCSDVQALQAAILPPEDQQVREKVRTLRARLQKAEALASLGKTKEGLVIAEQAEKETRKLGYPPIHARALFQIGNLTEFLGDHARAEQVLYQAVEIAAEVKDMKLHARIWSVLLWLIGERLQRNDEIDSIARYTHLALALAGNPDELVSHHLSNYGQILYRQGKYEQARSLLQESVNLKKKVHGDQHPEVMHPLHALGLVCVGLGQYDQARHYFEQTLVIREEVLGPEHPTVAFSLIGIGHVMQLIGDYKTALAHFEKALAISNKAFGPDHPDRGYALNNLGELMSSMGEYERARTYLEEAMELWAKSLGPEHAYIGYCLHSIGRTFHSQGKFNQALERNTRSLEILNKALGPDHPDLALALLGLGQTYLGLRKPGKARPYLEKAMSLTRKNEKDDPGRLAATQFALAKSLWQTGTDRKRALALAEQARLGFSRSPQANLKEAQQEALTWLEARGRKVEEKANR